MNKLPFLLVIVLMTCSAVADKLGLENENGRKKVHLIF